MNPNSKSVKEVLPLLKSYSYKITEEHEDWIEFLAPDKTHTAHLSHSTLSFCHLHKWDFQYIFGVGPLKYIEKFLENPPSFVRTSNNEEGVREETCKNKKKTKK